MNASVNKIKIAVSSCLLGRNVRYDGKNKNNDAVHKLCTQFDCIAVCPEAEVGLGTPRPPLVIVKEDHKFRARGRTNPGFDVTDALERHAQHVISRHSDICGYIFKSRSPSCGVNSTLWQSSKNSETGLTSGIYSAKIKQLASNLPVIEETQLCVENNSNEFVKRVIEYATATGTV